MTVLACILVLGSAAALAVMVIMLRRAEQRRARDVRAALEEM